MVVDGFDVVSTGAAMVERRGQQQTDCTLLRIRQPDFPSAEGGRFFFIIADVIIKPVYILMPVLRATLSSVPCSPILFGLPPSGMGFEIVTYAQQALISRALFPAPYTYDIAFEGMPSIRKYT